MLRQGIREVLAADPEFDVVAETGAAAEAVTFALRYRPDVAVIAADMRGAGGIETTRRIVALLPETVVIVTSMNKDERYVSQARQAGALGYVVKNEAADKLVDAIRRALRERSAVAQSRAVATTLHATVRIHTD